MIKGGERRRARARREGLGGGRTPTLYAIRRLRDCQFGLGMKGGGKADLYMLLSLSITDAFAQANFDTSPGGVREIGTGKFKSILEQNR